MSGDIGESIQANESPKMGCCAKNSLQLHISYVYRPILSLKIVYWPNLERILYFTLTFLTAAMESILSLSLALLKFLASMTFSSQKVKTQLLKNKNATTEKDHPFKTSAFLGGGGVKNWPKLFTDSSKKTADGGG